MANTSRQSQRRRRITEITTPTSRQASGSRITMISPSGMMRAAGTSSESALMLLLSMTAAFSSPFIQFITLPRNWALPPDTALLMLSSSRLAQLIHTTRAPVSEFSAATATSKLPVGSFSPCWMVVAVS